MVVILLFESESKTCFDVAERNLKAPEGMEEILLLDKLMSTNDESKLKLLGLMVVISLFLRSRIIFVVAMRKSNVFEGT